jgi:catechol 2,3-dioxygenase-like lactoylglutathione lyase family enzyme
VNLKPTKLDHVALYVSDADAVAARILAQLPFRVIEETDEFVLVGRDPQLGKLTLFRAEAPRERGVLRRVGIGVPCTTVERSIEVGDDLALELVPGPPDGEVELRHLAVLTPDPATDARAWLEFGFEPAPKGRDGVPRVRVGDQHLELWAGSPEPTRRPLLNHVGLLVDSLDEVVRAVEERGEDVSKLVEAENSRALFLRGPDGVELEYIEHKPSFAYA